MDGGKFDNPGDALWKVSAGLTYVNEEYRGGLGSSQQWGLGFGSEYKRRLGGRLMVTHDLSVVPAFDDFGDVLITSFLTLSRDISGNFRAGLTWYMDYDSTPAPGQDKANHKFLLTAGYAF